MDSAAAPIDFRTDPSRYKHWKLAFENGVEVRFASHAHATEALCTAATRAGFAVEHRAHRGQPLRR